MVHRNFVRTDEMVINLTEMYSKLSTVESQLATSRENILGPSPYLLSMHHQLNALEDFRNQTMHMAKPCSADVRNTLKRHFERLDGVIKVFEEYLRDMAGHVLEIVRAGNGTAIVKLAKIAEMEGKEDEKVKLGNTHESFFALIVPHRPPSGDWHQTREEGCQD